VSKRIRIENNRSFALVKTDAESVEYIKASEQVKSDAKLGGETHSDFDAMRSHLHWNRMEKHRNEASITDFYETPLAALEIEPNIPCEIPVND